MKSTLKLAALSVLGLAAGNAVAVTSSDPSAANRVYISGATATNPALYELTILASGGICQSGGINVYIDTATVDDPPVPPSDLQDANDQFMVACNAAVPGLVGTPILISKESEGGSNNGTRDVAQSNPLNFLDPANPGCTGSANIPAAGALNAYTLNYGCSNRITQVPDAGFADVESNLFFGGAANSALLKAEPLFQIIFAPAVSLNTYRALQTAQGLTQDDAPANIPQLTRGQVTAMLNETVLTWDSLSLPGGGAFLPGEDVYVCRRGNDSGTQASFDAFFLNNRCVAAGLPPFVGPTGNGGVLGDDCEPGGCDWDAARYGNDFVFAGDGSGDVRACLDYRDSQGQHAIGVLSTNTRYNSTDREFRFIGIDGGVPTLSGAANGGYPFLVENVLNTRVTGAPTGTQLTIANYIRDNAGLPSIVAGLNVSSQQPGGIDTGILSVPLLFGARTPNTAPVSAATMRTNPVSSYTRSVTGAANNCSPSSTFGEGIPNQVVGGAD